MNPKYFLIATESMYKRIDLGHASLKSKLEGRVRVSRLRPLSHPTSLKSKSCLMNTMPEYRN